MSGIGIVRLRAPVARDYPQRRARSLVALALGCVCFLLAALVPDAAGAKEPAMRCEQLGHWQVPGGVIHLPTRGASVEAAAPSAAGDPDGSYCRVDGVIQSVDAKAQSIHFRVNLPARWNEKAVHVGGGGYDGMLVDGLRVSFAGRQDEHPIATGYVTFGSDSGHQSMGFMDPAPGAFALNEEELENFGGAQLKKTHDVALELIRHYYGSAPKRIYFYGNSQGGHEGLVVAQRWPNDYDGIVAIHPAYDFTALQLSGLHLGQVLYKSPQAWLSPPKVQLIANAVLRACDGLDGLGDGIIGNVSGCRDAFKLDLLRCEGGKDTGNGCLSDEQIKTARAFDEPTVFGFKLQGEVSPFARWPLLTGAFTGGPSFMGLGMSPAPSSPPAPTDAFLLFMADQLVRYMVLRDPSYNSLNFEPARHVDQLQRISKLVDANDADLDVFRARGGKLLLLHGTVDMAIAPENTVAYYDRLVKRYGRERLRTFTRFYMVPGFGHGDGAFQMRWDGLTAIDQWADAGKEPLDQVATDAAAPTAGRTRPLCEYPAWARYVGSGDANAAGSFRCTDR
jgi:pimeloyl-ACP methyl ester carboxylesterase